MMTVTVRKVETKADYQAFFKFPWEHYKAYTHWIPELPSLRRDTLNKEKHPAWDYMTGHYYVAWRGDVAVGTIAAFVNHRHNEYNNENIGFFGFFECENNQDTANALFKTAEDYLQAQGVDAIRGPANFSSNEQYGLLVDSFDKDPMVLMPYNPQYYIDLIENAGFAKEMDLYSWRSDFVSHATSQFYEADGKTEKRIVRAIRRTMKRYNVTVRPLDTKNKRKDFLAFRELYHSAWEQNWGFIPMTERELDALIRDLGFLVLPEYALFGFVDGEPAGFMMAVPNFNDMMKHVQPHPGLPEPWWLLKSAWHWKLRPKVRSIRGLLMGAKADYRHTGVVGAMFLHLGEQMLQDTRFDWAEAGWTLETNTDVNELVQHLGMQMHRTHRIYQKDLPKQ